MNKKIENAKNKTEQATLMRVKIPKEYHWEIITLKPLVVLAELKVVILQKVLLRALSRC
ncbi:MAG: hypothetical protein MUO60_11045 [Clostridiaceae bacterium]|nr:hypothetical protein [Clostridiaceae bacterium]